MDKKEERTRGHIYVENYLRINGDQISPPKFQIMIKGTVPPDCAAIMSKTFPATKALLNEAGAQSGGHPTMRTLNDFLQLESLQMIIAQMYKNPHKSYVIIVPGDKFAMTNTLLHSCSYKIEHHYPLRKNLDTDP